MPRFVRSNQQLTLERSNTPLVDDIGSYNYQTADAHQNHQSMTAREICADPSQRLIDTVNNLSQYQKESAPMVDQLQKKPSNLSTSRHKGRKKKTKFPQHQMLDVQQLNPDSARDPLQLFKQGGSDYNVAQQMARTVYSSNTGSMPKFLSLNSHEKARHEQKELAVVAKQRLIERSIKSQKNTLRANVRPQTGQLRKDAPGINSCYNTSTKGLEKFGTTATAASSARHS